MAVLLICSQNHCMNRIVILSLLVTGLASKSAWSQSTWTVCNLSNCPAQFIQIQDAIDAASPGDIIHVMASPLSYGDFTIDKGLSVLGAGHGTDPISGAHSHAGTVTIGASNAIFSGFFIRAVELQMDLSETIDEVEISNNRFYGSGNFLKTDPLSNSGGTKNWLVQGNVMTPDAPPNSIPIMTLTANDTSWTMSNNYIEQHWAFQRVFNGGSPVAPEFAHVFSNNLVYTGPSGAFTLAADANLICHSNLFWLVDSAYSFMPSNGVTQFMSNLMHSPMGSVVDPDPSLSNLVDEATTFAGGASAPTWDATFDYNLAPGSAGIGDGLAGSDVGIFGNFFAFSNRGIPSGMPVFTSISKAYEIVPLEAPLEVDVEWTTGEQ